MHGSKDSGLNMIEGAIKYKSEGIDLWHTGCFRCDKVWMDRFIIDPY